MKYTLGCDISKWQDNNATPQRPDLKKLWDAGYRFIVIRIAQGCALDEDWEYYWTEAKRLGFYRGAYQLLEYWKPNVLDQAKFLWDKIKADPGEIPPTCDYERPNQNFPELPARNNALTMLDIWFNFIDNKFGRPGMLYCNQDTILNNLRPRVDSGAWLWKHPLWISQPLYKLTDNGSIFQPLQHCHTIDDLRNRKPSYIDGWDKWTFWQWTFQLPGLELGMESKQFDGDLFNGDLADLERFCGLNVNTTPIPDFSDSEKLSRLWKSHPELH